MGVGVGSKFRHNTPNPPPYPFIRPLSRLWEPWKARENTSLVRRVEEEDSVRIGWFNFPLIGQIDHKPARMTVQTVFFKKLRVILVWQMFSNVVLSSSEKAWWTREFTKEYLPFVVSNSSLSILEDMLEKQGIYRVTSFKFDKSSLQNNLLIIITLAFVRQGTAKFRKSGIKDYSQIPTALDIFKITQNPLLAREPIKSAEFNGEQCFPKKL